MRTCSFFLLTIFFFIASNLSEGLDGFARYIVKGEGFNQL